MKAGEPQRRPRRSGRRGPWRRAPDGDAARAVPGRSESRCSRRMRRVVSARGCRRVSRGLGDSRGSNRCRGHAESRPPPRRCSGPGTIAALRDRRPPVPVAGFQRNELYEPCEYSRRCASTRDSGSANRRLPGFSAGNIGATYLGIPAPPCSALSSNRLRPLTGDTHRNPRRTRTVTTSVSTDTNSPSRL